MPGMFIRKYMFRVGKKILIVIVVITFFVSAIMSKSKELRKLSSKLYTATYFYL
jgi:hypothetical protein